MEALKEAKWSDVAYVCDEIHIALGAKDLERIKEIKEQVIMQGHYGLLQFVAICEDGIKKGYDPLTLPLKEEEKRAKAILTESELFKTLQGSIQEGRGCIDDHLNSENGNSAAGELYTLLFFKETEYTVRGLVDRKDLNSTITAMICESGSAGDARAGLQGYYNFVFDMVLNINLQNRMLDSRLIPLAKQLGRAQMLRDVYKPLIAEMRQSGERVVAEEMARTLGLPYSKTALEQTSLQNLFAERMTAVSTQVHH